jgi:hypothetical protein
VALDITCAAPEHPHRVAAPLNTGIAPAPLNTGIAPAPDAGNVDPHRYLLFK